MTKERQTNREIKKQPVLNLKEKRAAKRVKKEPKGFTIVDRAV